MKQIIAKVSFALLAGIAAVCLLAPQIVAAPDAKSGLGSDVNLIVGTDVKSGVRSDFISGEKSVVHSKVVLVSKKKSEATVVDGKNIVPCEIGKVKAPAGVNLPEVDLVPTCTESWDKFASGECDCFVGYDARGERHQR